MTTHWGPRQWYWYHSLSYHAPEKCSLQEQKVYLETLVIMTKLLPCQKCYDHFNKTCQKVKINFQTKEKMIHWFIEMHNHVNKRLKKDHVTREEADQLYQNEINHLYLNQYLQYHCNRAIFGHAPINLVVELVKRLFHLYPCLECRNVMLKYLRHHPLEYFGNNIPTFTKWVNNFFQRQNLEKHFEKKWKQLPIRLRRK